MKFEKRLPKKWNKALFWLDIAFLLLTLGLGGLKESLDNRWREGTLRKIAEQSRPSLIFDATTHIVSDMGAAKYVKGIRVTNRLGTNTFPGMFDPNVPQHIEIELDRHFGNPPILTALYDNVRITAEPGKVFLGALKLFGWQRLAIQTMSTGCIGWS